MDKEIEKVKQLTNRISMNIFGTEFKILVERDNKRPVDGRIFIQVVFNAPCESSGVVTDWHGRKWQLSDAMTADEIIKTAYSAFKSAVEHEAMEAFKVDGVKLFNPHINFEELLKVSHKEVRRAEHKEEIEKLKNPTE